MFIFRSTSSFFGSATSDTLLHNAGKHTHGDDPGSPEFWLKMLISAALVLLGGVFAGLTLGLMGLDELHLRVLAASSDDRVERRNASKVLKLLNKGRHWVLVVLLLSNVIVNESLPIFLDGAIGGGLAAVIISTVMIVIFGYVSVLSAKSWIIPQAVCARYGLLIGARCAPFVRTLMYIFSPIAYPIARLLDRTVGTHDLAGNTYKKAELKSFLQFHRHGEEPLGDQEIRILNGVLELNTKSVVEIMTPIEDVVTIAADTILDRSKVDDLLLSGYSRFPVHEPGRPHAFIGLLLIKKLLSYDPSECLPVSKLDLLVLPEAGPTISCFHALDYFQTGRAHILLISKNPGIPDNALGVITLEDVIEEIISEEIIDETDQYQDNHSKMHAKRRTTAVIMKGIVEGARRAHSVSTRSSPYVGYRRVLARPESVTEETSLLGNGNSDHTFVEEPTNYGATAATGPAEGLIPAPGDQVISDGVGVTLPGQK